MNGSSYKRTYIPELHSLNTIFNSNDDNFFQNDEEQLTESGNPISFTPEEIYSFFEQMSEFLITKDKLNLENLLKKENITSFDDSFNTFEIANLASKLYFKISDDTTILTELLDFFLKLIHIDNQYIYSLLDAGFLEYISPIYADVISYDCSIAALRCASSIVKALDEPLDEINSLFSILTKQKPIKNHIVFSEILILVSAILDFEIDSQKLNTISAFLFSEEIVKIIYLYHKNSHFDKDYNEKIIACQNYTQCLLKLSNFNEWLQIFPENLIDLFIHLLSSKDKYILINSSISLLPIIRFIPIKSEKLAVSVINLLFNDHATITEVGCLALRYLITGPNIELFSDEKFFEEKSNIIFNQLKKLLTTQRFDKKVPAFDALGHFLIVFIGRLQEMIMENQDFLFDIIEEILDLEENRDSIPIALTILDNLFRNESDFDEDSLFSKFVERGGLDQIKEIELNLNDGDRITEYVHYFLTFYDCFLDDFTYEEIDVK